MSMVKSHEVGNEVPVISEEAALLANVALAGGVLSGDRESLDAMRAAPYDTPDKAAKLNLALSKGRLSGDRPSSQALDAIDW